MKYLNLMSMKLQYFSNPDGDDGKLTPPADNEGSDGTNDDSDNQAGEASDGKKYNDKDVNEIVAKKLARWKSEQAEKDKEAKKLAEMNANQKKDYEIKKANEAAATAKAQVARYEMTDTARKMAADADINLTDEDLNHLVTEDADTTKTNMDWLAGLKDRIAKDVKSEYLKGNPPKAGGNKLEKKSGSYGANLAQQTITRKNPYFKS
ncbi:DUF4355 domain-containing protein [Levilactobacillus lanxiensis]|uniref:DUF4355 domain-containing protein n=1 Tax=Levilactobacillus lanxiensis TaxID=2799568 RepID=A0ABW4D0X5_9LACO|nr:DUF4355 domain-containing protein [Levilactobacillus lanxiensis]